MKKSTLFTNGSQGHCVGILRRLFYFLAFLTFSQVSVYAESKSVSEVSEVQQNTIQIKGRVLDDKGEPAIGANVVVKGTTNGTVTDLDGNYILKVDPKATIVVSYIGFQPQQFAVNGKNVINIKLVLDSKSLDEVVVVGYGQVKRANLLGSVTNISSEKIKDMPVTNLAAAIEGQMPGVKISQNSGNPTAANQIQIRVNPSKNVAPVLFVIDGVIYEDQSFFDILDPTEVESISVLKDASAAVYGSRASGGVIVVKTKKGKEGKPKINYSGSYGISDATQFTKMLSAYDQATLINDYYAEKDGKGSNTYNQYSFSDDELETFKSLNYDWLSDAWKSSSINRQTVNVSGGSDKIKYFGSGAYLKETGNFENLSAIKYTLRLGVEANVTKDLTANFSISTDNKETKRPYLQGDSESDYLRSTFQSLLQAPKWIPSSINGYPVGQGIFDPQPIAAQRVNSYQNNKDKNTIINTSLAYTVPFVKGLKLSLNFSKNNNNSYSKQYRKPYTLYTFNTLGGHNHILGDQVLSSYSLPNGNRFMEDGAFGESYQLNTGVNYSNKFGKHSVDAMLQYEQSEGKSYGIRGYREDMVVDNVELQSAFSDAKQTTVSLAGATSSRLSYIGRLNYSYADKYLFESTFRYEASNKFIPSLRWGFFPSVSVGWRVSEEPFFKESVEFIDNLKVRATAGLLGNDQAGINDWQLSYTLASGKGAIIGNTNTAALSANNNGLVSESTWEKQATFNGGIDLKFINNISFSVDGFFLRNYDILEKITSTLPNTTGIDSPPKVNYGIQHGWGYEMELGYNGKIDKDWGYSLKGNYAFSAKKIVRTPQSAGAIGTWADQIGTTGDRTEGLIAKGIIRTQEQLDAILANNPNYKIYGMTPTLGMVDYEDVGGADYSRTPDGQITDDDKVVLSKYGSDPRSYGAQIGLNWKGLSFDANFTGSYGSVVFYDKNAYSLSGITSFDNLPEFWKDHWTPDNTNAKYPKLYNNAAAYPSTFWMHNSHILRLSSVNLSYSLPNKTLSSIGVSGVRLYITARNVAYIIRPYSYKDPSLAYFNSYPLLRSVNFGLNFTL